jgi:hypothetical protein
MGIKNTALEEVFEELRRSIFAAYTALVDHNQEHEVTIGSPRLRRRKFSSSDTRTFLP